MPRRARVLVEDAVYHVYNRFAHGAEILASSEERERFIDLLDRARRRDGLTVLAWRLMSNHYHPAVRTDPIPLSRTLGFVQASFAQGYNRLSHGSGPLWQSRYKAKLVDDERYLGQLIAYIHLNPVAAGLVIDPADHGASGHRELLGRSPAHLVDVAAALGLFAGTRCDARRVYLATLRGIQEERLPSEAPGRLPWWQPEPDRSPEPAGDRGGERRTRLVDRQRLGAEDLLTRASRHLGIDTRALAGPSEDRAVSRLRYLVAAVGVRLWGVGTMALAEVLGRRADAVTRWVHRGAELRQRDTAFRRAYDELDEALAGNGVVAQ